MFKLKCGWELPDELGIEHTSYNIPSIAPDELQIRGTHYLLDIELYEDEIHVDVFTTTSTYVDNSFVVKTYEEFLVQLVAITRLEQFSKELFFVRRRNKITNLLE